MTETRFTIIDDGTATDVLAVCDGDEIRLAADALYSALGWELKPEGLCRGDVCVPVRDGGAVEGAGRIRLDAVAQLLDRPLALDVDAKAAALGTSERARGAQLDSLEAPDFTLLDLNGKEHTLSHFRGTKILLVAYASW